MNKDRSDTWHAMRQIHKKIDECQFLSYGKCGKATEKEFCETHEEKKCVYCRKQAVKYCFETRGPMVCGKSICNNCKCCRGY